MSESICLEVNPDWVNPATRPACKYAPVSVSKNQTPGAIARMQRALHVRIDTCRSLTQDHSGWFSFMRGNRASEEPGLRASSASVPVIVISGGSAMKIARDLNSDHSLAWHPDNVRGQPLYLLVHRLDYSTYEVALQSLLAKYRNMHLIGWHGGNMTGFGAARAAALAFADSLTYRPRKILLMDQDVVQTESTRHTNPSVQKAVQRLHRQSGSPIVGFGVGYPTRQAVPRPFQSTPTPGAGDFNSPVQQFVCIEAPFRKKGDDGLYPAYMVAGGEDMLVGFQLGLTQKDRNIALLGGRIVKKELMGPADTPNAYWNEARVDTLKALYEVEQKTQVNFDGADITLGRLMSLFTSRGWLKGHPSPDSYNASACVIERIILRLHKIGKFPAGASLGPVFNSTSPRHSMSFGA